MEAKEQERKRTRLSLDEYNSARIAEARSSNNHNMRQENLKLQQQAAQLEKNRRTSARQSTAIQTIDALARLAGIQDSITPSRTHQYENIHEGMQNLHERVQEEQSGIVNEIQNYAWADIKERHLQTLAQVEDLKRTLDFFSTESSPSTSDFARSRALSNSADQNTEIINQAATSSQYVGLERVESELAQIASGRYGINRQSAQVATASLSNPGVSINVSTAPNCSGSPVAPPKYLSSLKVREQGENCVAAQAIAEERNLALAHANQCQQISEATAIKIQLEAINKRIKLDCQ